MILLLTINICTITSQGGTDTLSPNTNTSSVPPTNAVYLAALITATTTPTTIAPAIILPVDTINITITFTTGCTALTAGKDTFISGLQTGLYQATGAPMSQFNIISIQCITSTSSIARRRILSDTGVIATVAVIPSATRTSSNIVNSLNGFASLNINSVIIAMTYTESTPAPTIITTNPPTTTKNINTNNSSRTLNAGAIAGIIIGSILVVVGLCILYKRLMFDNNVTSNHKQTIERDDNIETNYSNVSTQSHDITNQQLHLNKAPGSIKSIRAATQLRANTNAYIN